MSTERECPECKQPVDEDGDTFDRCPYGPNECGECGGCYCDWSC